MDSKWVATRIHKAFLRAFERTVDLGMGPQATYDEGDLARVLEHAGMNRELSPTEASAQLRLLDYRAPDGDTVLHHLSKQDPAGLKARLDRLLDASVEHARREGLLRVPVDIAIDFNDEPWYGKKKPFTVRGKHQKGTANFIRFANASAVRAGRRFFVASEHAIRKSSKADLVEALTLRARERGVRIRREYLDRAFYTVEIIRRLDSLGVFYVMPARGTVRVKRLMKRRLRQGKHVAPYTVRGPKSSAETTLFLCYDRKRGKWSPFITNLPVDESNRSALGEDYRTRWSIETGFRVRKGFRIRSCSGVWSVRMAYYLLALVLYNYWVLLNIWEARVFGVPPDKPLISVDRFQFYIEILLHAGSF